jgi:hypothetical protein
MGWYEHPRRPGVMVGDEVFDVAHDFLQQLADRYERSFQRRPTLEEATVLLEIALKASGGELLADLEERRVTQVVVKTEKKPRDQPFAVGDVFAIPLGGGRFAFGRILWADKARGLLVEVFRRTARSLAPDPSIVASGRLFHPVLVVGKDAFKSWRWTVVASDAGYTMRDEDRAVQFVAPSPGKGWCVVDLHNKIVRTVSEEEAKGMERGWLWDAPKLEERIREALAAA